MKVVVWGIGKDSSLLRKSDDIEYIGVDKCYSNKTLFGEKVFSPSIVKELEFDYLLIATSRFGNEITDEALEMGIDAKKILYMDSFQIAGRLEREWEDSLRKQGVSVVREWRHIGDFQEIVLFLDGFEDAHIEMKLMAYQAIWGGIMSVTVVDIENNAVILEEENVSFAKCNFSVERNGRLLKVRVRGYDGCRIDCSYFPSYVERMIDTIPSERLIEGVRFEINKARRLGAHERDYLYLASHPFDSIQGGVIFDIGANIGQSSVDFLRLCEAEVFAFEPQPKMFEVAQLIKECFDKENRLHIYNIGIGERDSEEILYIPTEDIEYTQEASLKLEKALSMFSNRKSEPCSKSALTEVRIDVRSIDSLVAEIGKTPQFIKIDAEGFEKEIIRGMKKTIRDVTPVILLEYNNDEEMNEIVREINTIFPYEKRYWDYNNECFTIENLHGSIDYFMVPSNMIRSE